MRQNPQASSFSGPPLSGRSLADVSRWRAYPASATTILRGCFVAGLVLQSKIAFCQEALRNSLAVQATANTNRLQPEGLPYTFKSGDFRVVADPSMNLEWNDNVTLRKDDPESDFILRPAVGIDASYPVTDWNLFRFNVTFGYDHYLNHNELSRFYLASGSQIAFDIFVKDFHFNLHNSFSYTQDSATEAAVAGTGDFGTFENTAGISGTWKLKDVTLELDYDHQLTRATSTAFSYTDQSSELFVGRAGIQVYPRITVGMEASGTLTTYDQSSLNDSKGWSSGIYGEWSLGSYFTVTPRFGYSIYYFQQTSSMIVASDESSWYANLSVNHQATRFLSYSLDAGRESRLGVESDLIEDYYIRPDITWSVIKNVSIGTSFSYEYGSQRGGQLGNTFGDNYHYYGFNFNIGCSPLKRLNAGLYYRLILRSSNVATAEYTQNLVGATLTYVLP